MDGCGEDDEGGGREVGAMMEGGMRWNGSLIFEFEGKRDGGLGCECLIT